MDKKYKLDLTLSAFTILFSAALFFFIIPFQISVPEELVGSYLSPATAPVAYTLFLGAMGVALLASTIIGRKISVKTADLAGNNYTPQKTENDKADKKEYILITVKLWTVFLIFVFLLNYIGILASSIIFMFYTILSFGSSSKKTAAIISLAVSITIYAFFRYVADVPLPEGVLFEYFF